MEHALYLECTSGISGDMIVAALLDLGADESVLRAAIDSLPVDGFSIEISRVKKSGLDACDFNVRLDEAYENHDHDMDYLYGRNPKEPEGNMHAAEPVGHVHLHVQEGEHAAGHSHTHAGHGGMEAHVHTHAGHGGTHSHSHRGLKEILEIIRHAELTEGAAEIAVRTFQILAEAEAKAHGTSVEQVHFHEVGAVDSIVDIIAAAVCLDHLGISEVILPELCEGQGMIRCQHGLIPVPVPAVVNIVQSHGLHLHFTGVQGELVTPTGAAIAAAVRTSDHLPETFQIERIGIGAGKRTYERPGILRAMWIRETRESGTAQDRICRLETNMDDCSGELLGYVMERLFEAGARDVYYTPIFMKKNRPAYQLNVLCDRGNVSALEEIIFRETTTIGIRRMEMERTVLERKCVRVSTRYGEAEVKVCRLPDGKARYYPEYAAAAELAARAGISCHEAYLEIQKEAVRQHEL